MQYQETTPMISRAVFQAGLVWKKQKKNAKDCGKTIMYTQHFIHICGQKHQIITATSSGSTPGREYYLRQAKRDPYIESYARRRKGSEPNLGHWNQLKNLA